MKAYLLFENGDFFAGTRFGADADAIGGATFTTNSVGAVEALTDPSNAGLITVFASPSFGNEGAICEDAQSGRCHLKGVVVREWCGHPSNVRAAGPIDEYMKANGVAGICGIDTRALIKSVSWANPMRAAIVSRLPEDVKAFFGTAQCPRAGVAETIVHHPQKSLGKRVALLDNGARADMIGLLTDRGFTVHQLPGETGAEEILNLHADGLILSDGPGDPKSYPERVETIQKLLGILPIFGVGLGHLLIALATGGETERLPLSHRGANLPVKCAKTGRAYITAQSHDYAVRKGALPKGASLMYINLDDNSVEGLFYPGLRAQSAAFVPMPGAAARDLTALYDTFIDL